MPYTFNPISGNLDYYTISTVLSGTISDHGDLTGLSNDNHLHYHTNARGDARYYTKSLLNNGQLDNRYYTEIEINTISGTLQTDINTKALDTIVLKKDGSVLLTGDWNTGARKIYINDAENTKQTVGLTINQAENDDEIVTFKSTDVTHGITNKTETDTFGFIKKVNPVNGGLRISGYTEGTRGLRLSGRSTTENTNHGSTSRGTIHLRADKKSGTGFTALSDEACIFTVRNNTSTKAILTGKGDLYVLGELTTASGKLQDNLDEISNMAKPITFNCPAITIANEEYIQIYRFTTNENAKIKIWSAGLSALGGGQLAGSYVSIYNETDLQTEYQTNNRFISGNPITTLNLSQKDTSIRAYNGTGVAVDLHGFITITQE